MKQKDLNALKEDGYFFVKQLPNGDVLALREMVLTTGLWVLVPDYADAAKPRGWDGARTRYCYERWGDALVAAFQWDGQGDPPGPWVKQKPQDRLNPMLASPEFDRYEDERGRGMRALRQANAGEHTK